jgi:hypothetical protein
VNEQVCSSVAPWVIVTRPLGTSITKSACRGPTHWMSPTTQPAGSSAWAVYVPAGTPKDRSPASRSSKPNGELDQVGLSRRYGITVGSPAGSLWLVMRSVAAASAVVTAKQIRNTSITLRSIVLQPCANGCGRVNGRAARPVSFSGSGGGYGRRHDA